MDAACNPIFANCASIVSSSVWIGVANGSFRSTHAFPNTKPDLAASFF
jgi:hypothetical protein